MILTTAKHIALSHNPANIIEFFNEMKPLKKYNYLNQLSQWVGSKRWGSAIFAPILPHLDRLILRLTGWQATATTWLSGLPVVMLTTIGAKSGLSRTVPLLYIQDPQNPNNIIMVASNWGRRNNPAWYFNLKANPHAECGIEGKAYHCTAQEVYGTEYDRCLALAKKLYAAYSIYKDRANHRHIPIMVLQIKMTPPKR